MSLAAPVQAPPPCRAGDEAELNEKGFDHFFKRVARFGKARGQRLDPNRPAAREVGDHGQVTAIDRVEAERVDFQPV